MSTDLREELDALARTQTFTPDPSVWDRGRRARRRDRALAAVVAVGVLGSATGLALSLQPDREAGTASTTEVGPGAIPHRIDDIPADLEPTTDLAVGRASAAFVSGSGDAVVITATDGEPHRLALPAWGPDRAAFALSPDGRRLAFQLQEDRRVEVLDLETGTSTGVHVGDDTEVDDIGFSPDSSWVGWISSAVGDAPSVAGRFRVAANRSERAAVTGVLAGVAIADDGTVALGGAGGGLRTWRGDQVERVPLSHRAAPGAFSADGRHLALASGPGTSSHTLDVERRQVVQHPFPDATFGESVVRPLGWVDDRLQLLLVHEIDGTSGELVVTTPEVDDTSTWRRSVGSVATTGVANSLSLAVDLVPDLDGTSSQELTHDFRSADSPPAPFGIELSLFIGLGVAAAIALLMALRRLWRRLS